MFDVDVPLETEGPKAKKSSFLDYTRHLVDPAGFVMAILKISPIMRRIWHWAPEGASYGAVLTNDVDSTFHGMEYTLFGNGNVELPFTFGARLVLFWARGCGIQLSPVELGWVLMAELLALTPLVEESLKTLMAVLGVPNPGVVWGVFEAVPLVLQVWPQSVLAAVVVLAFKVWLHHNLGPEKSGFWRRWPMHVAWNGIMLGLTCRAAIVAGF